MLCFNVKAQSFATATEDVKTVRLIAQYLLKEKASVPMVLAKARALKELRSEDLWSHVTVEKLEELRESVRDLMQFLKGEKSDKFDIDINDTNETIENRVSEIGAQMLVEYLSNPDKYPAHPQTGEPTYTRKWMGADEMIDWSRAPHQIHNQIRALGCGRTKINGIDTKILQSEIVGDNLRVLQIQPAGKNPMDWRSFVNGLHGAEIKYGE